MSLVFPKRWRLGFTTDTESLKIALSRLERTLQWWMQRLEQGPIPGGYLTFNLQAPGSVTVSAALDTIYIPTHMKVRPVLLSASLGAGSCTLSVDDAATSIMTANMSLGGANPLFDHIATRPDFATDLFPSNTGLVNLQVTAASGASDLHVVLVVKHVQQAEEL